MFNIKGKKCKFWVGGKKVKKIYLGASKVFSAGNWVTYNVDKGDRRSEEFDEGTSVLTPTTFTPTKTGWTFHGWKETLDAVSSVLSTKIMGEDPITLYGVFKKLVTLTVYNNNTTADKKTGYRYYNNENITNPSFTVSPATKSGWAFLGWTKNSSATGDVAYTGITNQKFTADETIYGKYSKNVTLSYDGNGATSGSTSSQTSPAYYNSSGDIYNPTFTVNNNGFARTNYTFASWGLNNVNGNQYSPGTLLQLDSNAKLYAIWDLISGTAFDYNYTQNIQQFVAPVDGTYQLEVYGAQGGSHSSRNDGGKGGYSKGTVDLKTGDVLYIGVGGAGANHTGTAYATRNGGYNGGGNGYDCTGTGGRWYSGAGGGGATHIAKGTNRGILSNYASYKSEVLIVAGGGGGSFKGHGWEDDGTPINDYSAGGTGGGTSGGNNGGTQSNGGSGYYTNSGTFGQGGSYSVSGQGAAGGGGGYYGGGGHINQGAGGGSGFIGGVNNGTTTNGKRSGNGYAKVTYLGKKDSGVVTYVVEGTRYTETVNTSLSCLNPKSFTLPTKSGYSFVGWSYIDDGEILTSCMMLGKDITLYAVYKPNVYEATYTSELIYWYAPTRTISVNNTTYIDNATYMFKNLEAMSPDSSDYANEYNSGNVNIINLKAAAKNFKYADVTFVYYDYAGFGWSDIYIDGSLVESGDQYTYKTYTWDLNNKTSAYAKFEMGNRATHSSHACAAFVGVSKVVLYN